MSFLINIADVWTAFRHVGMNDEAATLKRESEALTERFASILATRLGIVAGSASMDHDDLGGLCVAMFPASEGQPLPEALEGADDESEWGE